MEDFIRESKSIYIGGMDVLIRGNKMRNIKKAGISVPETMKGIIEDNDIDDALIGIEVRTAAVEASKNFIDSIQELSPEEKAKFKEIIGGLGNVEEEVQTLSTKVKAKLGEYANEIGKQAILPYIITELGKLLPHF